MKEDLVLLGRWPEAPLVAWPGFCDVAQGTFLRQTGFLLEPFTLSRKGLHEQYYLASSVEPLRAHFTSLSEDQQTKFSEELYAAYYENAGELEAWTSRVAQQNIGRGSAADLDSVLDEWMQLPAQLAGAVFFALLLDIWYPDPASVEDVRELARRARDHCAHVYDERSKIEARRLFAEIARRLDSSLDELDLLFPNEIRAWLHGDPAQREKVADRTNFYVTANSNGGYSILSGAEASEYVSRVALPEVGQPREHLEGISAHGGLVTGVARRVLTERDVENFDEGAILVANQTSIWCEPAFKRARAVVTELGGLTSHAAVVCSEQRIPCIVAVDDLMVSVNDGDLLIVNASSGRIQVEREG